jgi:hypothetical protein
VVVCDLTLATSGQEDQTRPVGPGRLWELFELDLMLPHLRSVVFKLHV